MARIEVFGGEVRQIQIQVKPDRLIAYNLSIAEILPAARRSTGVRGAGFIENENQRIIENENQRITLHTKGQSLSPEALGEVMLAYHDGFSVRLKDVASVTEGPEPKLGDGQVMGRSGIVMLVHSQYGANTLEVTRAVEAALDELRPLFAAEKVTLHPVLFALPTSLRLRFRTSTGRC